jgi:hypothetical protein
MLEELGLTVTRAIPPETLLGLVSGSLSLHGGVVRDAAGRIVAHLALPAATGAFKAIPGVGLVSELITNYQLKSISDNVQKVLDVALANTALSGLTLATSLVGFGYLAAKVRQIDSKLEAVTKQTKEIKQILQSHQRAQLLEAIDSLRHASQAVDADTRRQLLLQSKQTFGELAHHYKAQMAERTSLQEIEASEDFFTLACIGGVMCTSEIGLFGPARDDLLAHYDDWKELARQQTSRFLNLDEAGRLLDSRYVEVLPAATLVDILDFAHGTSRQIGWIDDLRQQLGKGTLLAAAMSPIDDTTINYAKKLRARNEVLQSYVAHYSFLSEKKLSASAFGSLLEQQRTAFGADLLWVASQAEPA